MPTNSTKPTWIEPPPPKPGGMGCFAKGCLVLVVVGALALLLFAVASYLLYSHGSKPTVLPVEELPSTELSSVQQRVDQFQTMSPPPAPSPLPTAAATTAVAEETPTPVPPAPERQLVLTADEINGLISANKKSRGHAFVSLSGNTAHVQISISSDKVPGFPPGYLNGSFTITTDGPTPINALQVSKIQANGLPVPSGVLSMSYRGRSFLSYAMEAAAPYNVSTAEIRDGAVILH